MKKKSEQQLQPSILGLVGRGRLATHFANYFSQLHLDFKTWHRDLNQSLPESLIDCTHIVLAISDGSILNFYQNNFEFLKNKSCVHCSGSLVVEGLPSAHPLMTFTEHPYSLEVYKSIPFVLEDDSHSLGDLIPNLPNSFYKVPKDLKPLYHSYCVSAGNFVTLLWNDIGDKFENNLDLPSSILRPYLKQVVENAMDHPNKALTGPLVRGDQKTINDNLAALKDDTLKPVYESFCQLYKQQHQRSKNENNI